MGKRNESYIAYVIVFDITAAYKLIKINDYKTSLTYTTTNRPLKWFLKLFLMFASDKVVVDFLKRVKKEAEALAANDK